MSRRKNTAPQPIPLRWGPIIYNGVEKGMTEAQVQDPNYIFEKENVPSIREGYLHDVFWKYVYPVIDERSNWRAYFYHLKHIKRTPGSAEPKSGELSDVADQNRIAKILNKLKPSIVVLDIVSEPNSLGFHNYACLDRLVVSRAFYDKFEELKTPSTQEAQEDLDATKLHFLATIVHELGHFILASLREEEAESSQGTPSDDSQFLHFGGKESGFLAEKELFGGYPMLQPNQLQKVVKYPSWRGLRFRIQRVSDRTTIALEFHPAKLKDVVNSAHKVTKLALDNDNWKTWFDENKLTQVALNDIKNQISANSRKARTERHGQGRRDRSIESGLEWEEMSYGGLLELEV